MLTEETKEHEAESKAEFWQRHIEYCQNGSLTQAQYCRHHSLALATFCYWKRKLNLTRQSKARFYPLTVQPVQPEKPRSTTAGISLHLSDDRFRIDLSEGFSEPALKKLISTLEQL